MELRVQFTKRPDGSVILRCTRKDNSATWQRHDKQPEFYSHHDLSHFAVETVLGLSTGFYGLIADGWDITEMDGKGPRGRLPGDGSLAEYIVGLFTQERSGIVGQLTAAEFNAQMEQITGHPMKNPLSDSQLNAVRDRITALYREWAELPRGSTLDLAFDRSAPAFAGRENTLSQTR